MNLKLARRDKINLVSTGTLNNTDLRFRQIPELLETLILLETQLTGLIKFSVHQLRKVQSQAK